VTESDAGTLEQVNPRATLRSVAGCGHMVPWDNLDDTTTEIESFIATIEARAGDAATSTSGGSAP